MNTFQQPCPSCGRQLELPTDALNRLGLCPACNVVFTAKGPLATTGSCADPAQGLLQQPAGAAESLTVNTAQNAVDPDDFQPTDNELRQVHLVAFDEIWLPAWRIYSERFGIMFCMGLLVTIVYLAGMAATHYLAGDNLLEPTPLGWTAFGVTAFLNQYLSLGLARATLAIARREERPGQFLFPSIIICVRYFFGIVVALIFAAIIGAVVAGIAFFILQAASVSLAANIAIVVGVFCGFLVMTAIYLVYWAYVTMASERRLSLGVSIRVGRNITLANIVTVLLLYLATSVLSLAGLLAFGVGMLFTTPFSWLLFTVAYLKMTGQRFYDPPQQQYTSLLHPSNL